MADENKDALDKDGDGKVSLKERNAAHDQERFTGQDLAEIVQPSKELQTLAGTELVDQIDAQDIIIARLGGNTNDEDSTTAADIAEIIVDSLPSTLLTVPAMTAIDLRPYLDAIEGKKITHRHTTGSWYLPDATGEIVASTAKFKEAEEVRVGDAGAYDSKEAGVTPVPAAVNADGETLPPNPSAVDPATGQPLDTELTDLTTAQGQASAITLNDIIEMINTDQWDLETAIDNAEIAGLSIPIDFGMTQADLEPGTGTRDRSGRPAPPHSRKVKDKPLTSQQALGYLQSLPPSKISEMQQKLANAGYFDELDNGGNYMPGDAHDPNTVRAMRAMITDTIQSGQSMPQLLGERMKSYRENAKAARMKQVMKMDPTYNRALANDFGQSVLGRNLRGDEIDELTNHLKTVIAKRAGFVSGADNNPGDGPLPDVRGYTDDDVDLHLGDKYNLGVEQRQNTQREMAYLLGKLAK